MMVLAQSVAIGLVLGFVFWEAIGLSAGGLVVPGYVALQLDRPLALAATLGIALLTWASVKGISRYAIVYGRRRFILMVLVGFSWQWLVGSCAPGYPDPVGEGAGLGIVIPGLIANEMDRQRIVPTLVTLLAVSTAVRCVLIVVRWAS
jgi:poly-gamma-glutamate biosynthesis protein PgsC/CapC